MKNYLLNSFCNEIQKSVDEEILLEINISSGHYLNLPKKEKTWNKLKKFLTNDKLIKLLKHEPDWLEFI